MVTGLPQEPARRKNRPRPPLLEVGSEVPQARASSPLRFIRPSTRDEQARQGACRQLPGEQLMTWWCSPSYSRRDFRSMKLALHRSVAVSCSAVSSGLQASFALTGLAAYIQGLTSHEGIDACAGADGKVSTGFFRCCLFTWMKCARQVWLHGRNESLHARLSTLHAQFRKVADLHRPIWKPGNDFQLTPHRLDVAT